MLVDFDKVPRACVYSVTCGSYFYVNYSTNTISSLVRLWETYGTFGMPGIALEFEALSVTTDIETLKLHTEYWRDEFQRRGLAELLPRGRKTLQYEVRCLVDGDYDNVDIVLVSARGDRKVVGKFGTMGEAAEFVEMYYAGDNPYNLPVYAINSRTREFVLDSGKSRIVSI
jgi:hypothetical protein